MDPAPTRSARRSRTEREQIVLDTAARLFYPRGVHAVGMDELVRESGLGKATVYRLFATKDLLVGAYLERLAQEILAQIDEAPEDDPAAALHAILAAIADDLARPGFRGCAFNNASMEYDDPQHPARLAARDYRLALHRRILRLSEQFLPGRPDRSSALADRLAVLIDGAYTSAAHLGPAGPAAAGLALAHELIDRRSDTT